MLFADGQPCLSQPEAQELFLRTETDASSPEGGQGRH